MESAIAPLENNQQLLVAAEAISQIVEVYVKRANGILDSLEVTDNSLGPILDDDFWHGLKTGVFGYHCMTNWATILAMTWIPDLHFH